jgi:Flp pilus assembly protein CpaB
MEPSTPSTASEALRKNTDLNHGTEKVTTARRTVAIKVTIKPGVAGFIGEVPSDYVLYDNERDESRRKCSEWPVVTENK